MGVNQVINPELFLFFDNLLDFFFLIKDGDLYIMYIGGQSILNQSSNYS
jgi:hypothetical protein